MPKVSVIMAIYNGEETLRESIESILGQTFSDFEILVIDDGSTDNSKKIIDEIKDERIKYFYTENSGKPATPRNIGLKKAVGEYIGFCDQDDLWYPEKLDKQIKEFKGEVALVATGADVINANGKVIKKRPVPEGLINSENLYKLLLNDDFITACSVLFKKSVIDKIGYLDENLTGNDDYDYWLKIAKNNDGYFITASLCAWRISEESLSYKMSKIFQENKKIFQGLLKEGSTQSLINGANKNEFRLFLALIKEKNYKEARGVLKEIKISLLSIKEKIIILFFYISPFLLQNIILIKSKLMRFR